MIVERLHCKHHTDKTPSVMVFDSGWSQCFSCDRREKVKDVEGYAEKERYVENIGPMLEYIRSLPVVLTRGLLLPTDAMAYYVVWPDDTYYKRRYFNVESSAPKYKGPCGVTKPLFKARTESYEKLLVCEGEINALTMRVLGGFDIISPGAASDFHSKRIDIDLQTYKNYKKIILMADADAAGTRAVMLLKVRLLPLVPHVKIHLMPKGRDANEILVNDGPEALRQEINRIMEL